MPSREAENEPELHLLFDVGREGERPHYLRTGIGSMLVNLAAFGAFAWLWTLGTGPVQQVQMIAELRQATHLTEPPIHISQPTTVHNGVTKKMDLESLTAHSQHSAPPPLPQPKRFVAPQVQSPKPGPAPLPVPPPPPKLEATNRNVPAPLGVNTLVPAPQIQAEEPKLALETPGQSSQGSVSTVARIPTFSNSIQDAMHSAARSTDQNNITYGEMEVEMTPTPRLPPGMGPPPSRLRSAIAPQILSDTHGVDFRPYIIRVLTAVRRNWQAVIPESARLGRRGVVTLQFAIAHDGSVPRLVISIPSGTEALDRAAVAGVSASDPFPPLPSEYTGNDLRLQLVFTYNMPRQ